MRSGRSIDPLDALEIAGGTVELWVAEPGSAAWPALEEARSLLTPRELERYDQVIDPHRRAWLLCARATVRVLLGARLDSDPLAVPLEQDGRGRPLLRGALLERSVEGLSLSISHCAGWLALALGGGVRVGVDVEPRRRSIRPKVMARVLTERELEQVRSVSEELRSEAFLRYWTAKEACGKALGTGLGPNLERLELTGGLASPRLIDPGLTNLEVRPWDPLAELLGAVAAGPLDI